MKPSHAFVVVTYGKSQFLEDCLHSLRKQSAKSKVTVSTSTPFDGLQEIAARHEANLFIHNDRRGIGADWNAALHSQDTDLVTIAHQDDIYSADFARLVIQAHQKHPIAAFSFCNAREIYRDGTPRTGKANQIIKKILVSAAFLGRNLVKSSLQKKILLGFGNPIICATVTINRAAAQNFIFNNELRTNMDWIAWLELAKHHPILRIKETLLSRRVHNASETTSCILDGARENEDKMVFESLWPKPIAKAILFLYKNSYSAYSN